MSGFKWSWKEFWEFHEILEEETRKQMINSLWEDEWLGKLPEDIQFEILEYAPYRIIKKLSELPEYFSLSLRIRLEQKR